MLTTLLYHGFGIHGYRHERSEFNGGALPSQGPDAQASLTRTNSEKLIPGKSDSVHPS